MNKWSKLALVLISIIVLCFLGYYTYVEISYKKAFEKYGAFETCCACKGKEQYDMCCDCEGPKTFSGKINYLKYIDTLK